MMKTGGWFATGCWFV